jgi:hypothetical protein
MNMGRSWRAIARALAPSTANSRMSAVSSTTRMRGGAVIGGGGMPGWRQWLLP